MPGDLSNFLGLENRSDQAQSYTSDGSKYQWQGPSQSTLGGYLGQAQTNAGQDYADQRAAGQGQSAYMNQLQQAYAGNGPSQAQAVMQQGANRAAANSMSLARSGGNGNPAAQAAAMRAAQQQGASGMVNASAQAAQIKAQEQQNALNQMGGALGQQRAQDLQAMGMNNQMAGTYLGGQMGVGNAMLGAGMGQDQLNAQDYNATQAIRAGANAQNVTTNGQLLAAGMEAAGSVAKFSDVNLKTDVVDASGNFGPNLGGPGHEVYDLPELSGDSEAYADGKGGDIRYVDPTMGGELGTPEAAQAFRGGGIAPGAPGAVPTPGSIKFTDPEAPKSGKDGDNVLSSAFKGFAAGFRGKSFRPDKGGAPPVSNKVGRPPLNAVMAPAAPGAPPPGAGDAGWQNFGNDPGAQVMTPTSNPNIAVTTPDLWVPAMHGGAPSPNDSVMSDERLKDLSHFTEPRTRFTEPGTARVTGAMDDRASYNDRSGDPSLVSSYKHLAPVGAEYPTSYTGQDYDASRRESMDKLRTKPDADPWSDGRGDHTHVMSDERLKHFAEPAGATERYKTHNEPEETHFYQDAEPAMYKPHNEVSLLNARTGRTPTAHVVSQTGGRRLEMLNRDSDGPDHPRRQPVPDEDTLGVDQQTNIYSDEKLKKLGLGPREMALLDSNVEDTPQRRQRLADSARWEQDDRQDAIRRKVNNEDEASLYAHPEQEYAKAPPGIDEPREMSEADHFLNHLRPYTYRYKDPSNEPTRAPTGGHYLGVMAQDVERTPNVGSQIVKDTPRGKMLEGGAMMSAMAAGLGRLHERVQQIEAARKGGMR